MIHLLACEPVSCAIALSLMEHAIIGGPRVCRRTTKVWLVRRAPALFDAALNEASDPVLDALNGLDHHLTLFFHTHNLDWGGDAGASLLLLLCAAVVYNIVETNRRFAAIIMMLF